MPLRSALCAAALASLSAAPASAAPAAAAPPRAHIVMVVADDLGYDDLGHESVMGNSGKSISPNINKLMDDGIILHDYCARSAASASPRRSEPCAAAAARRHLQGLQPDAGVAVNGPLPLGRRLLCARQPRPALALVALGSRLVGRWPVCSQC